MDVVVLKKKYQIKIMFLCWLLLKVQVPGSIVNMGFFSFSSHVYGISFARNRLIKLNYLFLNHDTNCLSYNVKSGMIISLRL